MTERAKINLYHGDCMKAMRAMQDNTYELAIVDPPYGIGAEQGTNRASRRQFAGKNLGWDSAPPTKEFFACLQRVSVDQIIWGANHFIESIPQANSKCWVVWDKKNPGRCFSDAELAWGSNIDNVRVWGGGVVGGGKRVQELNIEDGGKIHPTQKPVKLYKWLLANYAKTGDKILDTHLGSGSIAIACHDMGFDLDAWEVDLDYYTAAVKRFNQHAAQLQMF